MAEHLAAAEGAEEKPQRQQRLFQTKIKVDESRVRISGSIQIPTDEDYTHGDVVEIVTKARVVSIGIEEHQSGLKVLTYTLKPESSTLTVLED
jgi:hypothetical protein